MHKVNNTIFNNFEVDWKYIRSSKCEMESRTWVKARHGMYIHAYIHVYAYAKPLTSCQTFLWILFQGIFQKTGNISFSFWRCQNVKMTS